MLEGKSLFSNAHEHAIMAGSTIHASVTSAVWSISYAGTGPGLGPKSRCQTIYEDSLEVLVIGDVT